MEVAITLNDANIVFWDRHVRIPLFFSVHVVKLLSSPTVDFQQVLPITHHPHNTLLHYTIHRKKNDEQRETSASNGLQRIH